MNTALMTMERSRIWKGLLLPAAAALVPLVVAFVGALITGTGSTGIVGSVEGISGASSRAIGDFGSLLPLGFAFGAGMVATVNPCGFAMLPAYLALYVGTSTDEKSNGGLTGRLAKAVLVGGVVTMGFVLLFGIAGIVIGGGARQIVQFIPWVGLTIGVVLAFVGAWVLSGGKLYSGLAVRTADRMGDPNSVNVKGYFLFGLSYGTASLSCTLPIFLAVIGTSLATGGVVDAIGQFIVYALGMGAVIMILTLAMAVFRGAMVGLLRKLLPYTQTLSALFMILAGAYIVFYWLTAGALLDRIV